MRYIFSLLFLIFCQIQTVAQDETLAVKFADVDDRRQSTSVFIKKTDAFLKKLLQNPESTKGFIAISGEDYETLMERVKIAKDRVNKSPELKRRVEISRPGTAYRPDWPMSEFWFIPRGAISPYRALTADYTCPTISIIGTEAVENSNEKIYFTASVSGGPDVTYQWKVTGGKIIDGKGTPAITVKVDKSNVKEITATLDVGNLEEEAHCPSNFSYTTKIRS